MISLGEQLRTTSLLTNLPMMNFSAGLMLSIQELLVLEEGPVLPLELLDELLLASEIIE